MKIKPVKDSLVFANSDNKAFGKSDLKNFYRIKLRNGKIRIFANYDNTPVLLNMDDYEVLDAYDETLKRNNRKYYMDDIVEVMDIPENPSWAFNVCRYGKTIAKREVKVSVTKKQAKKILKLLSKKHIKLVK